MRIHLRILFFICSITTEVFCQQSNNLHVSDLSTTSLKLGMSGNKIEDILGGPIGTGLAKDVATGKLENYSWDYDGLIVFLDSNYSVISLWLNSPKWSTHRGLHTGDTKSKTRKLYGMPSEEDEDGSWFYYLGTSKLQGIVINFTWGKSDSVQVKSIVIGIMQD